MTVKAAAAASSAAPEASRVRSAPVVGWRRSGPAVVGTPAATAVGTAAGWPPPMGAVDAVGDGVGDGDAQPGAIVIV